MAYQHTDPRHIAHDLQLARQQLAAAREQLLRTDHPDDHQNVAVWQQAVDELEAWAATQLSQRQDTTP